MLAPSPKEILPPPSYRSSVLEQGYEDTAMIWNTYRGVVQKLTWTGQSHAQTIKQKEEAAFKQDKLLFLESFPEANEEEAEQMIRSRAEHYPKPLQQIKLEAFITHYRGKLPLSQAVLQHFNITETAYPEAASDLVAQVESTNIALQRHAFRHQMHGLLAQSFEHQSKAYGLLYRTSELPYLYPEDYAHLRANNTAYYAAKMEGLTLTLQNPVWYRSDQKTLLQDFLEHGLLSPDELTALKYLSRGNNKEKVLRVINEANNELMRLQTN